ncbi:MAG TPA: glycosyltransferase family 39 protein [Solirubrobacteraceae bacterium]
MLRFYRLGHQGFWFDEGNTALLVQLSPGKMIGLLPQSESTPPLYYVVAWVWGRLFGFGEAGLRSLSALAGVLVVPVAYCAAAKLATRRVGMVAAALTASNPLLVWYSQEARSYELLVLLTALALLAFAHARQQPRPVALGAWAAASILSLATHYYAVLAIVPQAVALLARQRRSRGVWLTVAIVLLCGAGLIPLAVAQNATGHDDWIAATSLTLRLGQIVPQFLIGTGLPLHAVLEPVMLAIAIGAILLVLERGERRERAAALLAGGLALGGLILSLIFVAVGVDDLITRNLIAIWLPAALLIACGLGARRAGRLGIAAATVVCAIGIAAVAGVAFDRRLQRPDWRPVARSLGPLPASGSEARAILIQHYRTLLPLSLYLPRLHHLGRRGARVGQLDVISIRSPQEDLCWWGAACNLIPSRLQRSYPVPGFHEESLHRVHQFTILQMSGARPVLLRPSAVAAALRTTRLRRDELLIQSP